jgi:CubicO group peptidase (beta-lactamase class C family)
MTVFPPVWDVLDTQVAAGRLPGYVAALRHGGQVATHVGGRMSVEPGSSPMAEETLFRIASVTKPMGGALTLSLVHDGVLSLDDPISRWLPEAADPRVLVAPDAPLDQTVAAEQPITVRHLLTGTSGWGVTMEDTPRQQAMTARGVFPGALPPRMSADEFVARVAEIPLAFQPGAGWRYDTGIDLLGVLLARATGKQLSDLVAERITGPLGMTSTHFWTAAVDRLATAYTPGGRGLDVLDLPKGIYAAPPDFEKLSGGLVSTVGDVLRFYTAMADGGAPVLTSELVALMTTDSLTDEQRRQAEPLVGAGRSWGLGTGVDVTMIDPWQAPGRWGWTGGTGTTADVDPARDVVSVLLTQRAMAGPLDGFDYFWRAVAAAATGDQK